MDTAAIGRRSLHEQLRRFLIALVLAVLAVVVGIGVDVDAHASSAGGQVAGTRVAVHELLADPVVAASEAVRAGEGRRTTTLAPDVAIGLRVAPQTVAGSIRRVNPTGSTQNCVACAIATDARLAGHPASALAVPPQPISVLSRHFGGAWKNVPGPDEIIDMMNAAGPGARGIVYGAPPVGSNVGHVFNAVNQRGVVRFLDGQVGGAASFEGYTGFKFLWTHQL